MTKEQAKAAVKNHSKIHFIDEPERWGTATSLSDDESTMYYIPRGSGLFRAASTIDKLTTKNQ
jgi:hypothetical protein